VCDLRSLESESQRSLVPAFAWDWMNDSFSFLCSAESGKQTEIEETQNIIAFVTHLRYNYLCSYNRLHSFFDNWYKVSVRHWVLCKINSKNSLVLSVFALAGVKSALRFSQA
jgi:superfamily II RNA helicase